MALFAIAGIVDLGNVALNLEKHIFKSMHLEFSVILFVAKF